MVSNQESHFHSIYEFSLKNKCATNLDFLELFQQLKFQLFELCNFTLRIAVHLRIDARVRVNSKKLAGYDYLTSFRLKEGIN